MSDGTGEGDDSLLDSIALPILARGRPPKGSADITYVRDLTAEDILDLVSLPAASLPLNPLQTLRTAHHHVAKLMAEGKTDVMVSAMTGRTIMSLRQLRNDPTFCELLEHYKSQVQELFEDAQKKLATLGTTAVELLQERLEDPEAIKAMGTNTLVNIMESAYDRSIAPSKGRAGLPAGGGGGAAPAGMTLNIRFGSPESPTATGAAPIIDVTPNEADE